MRTNAYIGNRHESSQAQLAECDGHSAFGDARSGCTNALIEQAHRKAFTIKTDGADARKRLVERHKATRLVENSLALGAQQWRDAGGHTIHRESDQAIEALGRFGERFLCNMHLDRACG